MRDDRWTPEMLAAARALRARHAPASEYKAALGRTKAAAFNRLYVADNKEREATLRKARLDRIREERKAGDANQCIVRPRYVPEDVFLEAQRRHGAPQTLTGFICGDPPIGYRALDRKREQETA